MTEKKENTPVLVANKEWPVPDNILKWVKEERMINGLIGICKSLTPEEQVGNAEVVAYLNPATLRSPVQPKVTQIYLYCVTQVMKKHKIEVPEDIAVNELTEYETKELNDLKKWIYEKRGGKEKNPVINALNEVFGETKKIK